MNALQVEPSSGFLTSDDSRNFTAEQKIMMLKMANECAAQEKMPRVSDLCKAIGTSTFSFYHHLEIDGEFKRQWDEVLNRIEDVLSASLVENAKRANGVGAAAFWLKNRRPERWSDNPSQNQINVDFSWIKKIVDAFNPKVIATEAEIISTTPKDAPNSTAELADKASPSENMKYNTSNQQLSKSDK